MFIFKPYIRKGNFINLSFLIWAILWMQIYFQRAVVLRYVFLRATIILTPFSVLAQQISYLYIWIYSPMNLWLISLIRHLVGVWILFRLQTSLPYHDRLLLFHILLITIQMHRELLCFILITLCLDIIVSFLGSNLLLDHHICVVIILRLVIDTFIKPLTGCYWSHI